MNYIDESMINSRAPDLPREGNVLDHRQLFSYFVRINLTPGFVLILHSRVLYLDNGLSCCSHSDELSICLVPPPFQGTAGCRDREAARVAS